MIEKKKCISNIYIKEVLIFLAMYVLTIFHEWMLIDNIGGFFKGLIFFILLYLQAQINRIFIFPFLLKKETLIYCLLTLITTLIGAYCVFLINYFWLDPLYYKNAPIGMSLLYYFVVCIINTFTIMALSLMHYYSLEINKKKMHKNELTEMKLKFLAAQLSPHFFFNMLNNLYGVSLKEPNRTPDLILKLSELMRYQIENISKNEVKLIDELHFIRNYIGLEKERVGKRCKISYTLSEDIIPCEKYNVAPLLLIILIENAFNHSFNTKDWFVCIFIEIKEGQLNVNIKNSLSDITFRKSTSIGLKNIKQRLTFLYKGQYKLSSIKHDYMYQTTLVLQLNKYTHG